MTKILAKIDNKIVRLVVFAIIVLNDALHMLDVQALPFTNNEIAEGVSVVATILVGVWVYWKNNSFTEVAQDADKWLHYMKKRIKKQQKRFRENQK